MRNVLFSLIFFLVTLPVLSKSITYEVNYGFLTAGRIKIDFEPQKVVVTGKSSGLIGLFYHYKLYMVYNLSNETESFLYEKENSKERKYNFQKILQKKAWLPIVIKLLLERKEAPKLLKVGTYQIILVKVDGNNYTYKVKGSKRTKVVILKNWKPGEFPKKIEIETTKGTLTLEKVR